MAKHYYLNAPVFIDVGCIAPVSVKLAFTPNGVCVNGEEISGKMGHLLKFAAVRAPEGPWSMAWSWVFNNGRLHRLKHNLKGKIAQICSGSGIEIVCDTKRISADSTSPDTSFFTLRKPDHVLLRNPAWRAASAVRHAKEAMQNAHPARACVFACVAIKTCPLYFPAYSFLTECLHDPPAVHLLRRRSELIFPLLNGLAELRSWLSWLGRRFQENVIPENQRPIVEADCQRELEIRSDKLERLEGILNQLPEADLTERNALNRVLAFMRENADGAQLPEVVWEVVSKSDREICLAIQEEALEIVESHEHVSLLDDHTGHLLSALADLAGDPDFRFPEPDGKSDSWRRKSAALWARAAISTDKERSRTVSFEQCANFISDIRQQ